MGLNPASRARFDLSKSAILLLDPTPMGMAILVQILTGLGAKNLYRCTTVEEAKVVIRDFEIHLVIADSMSQTGAGYDFIRWIRRESGDHNQYVPVLLTAAHTRIDDVKKSRDCGGHFIVAKPLSPLTLLERIVWVSKEGRGFILGDTYVGPDRRFRDDGPPDGKPGRRREDKNNSGAGAPPDQSFVEVEA